MTKRTSNRFSPEVRQRAVRMVLDHGGDHAPQWAAIGSIAGKIGCTAETLREWVRQAERDRGQRPGATADERERVKALVTRTTVDWDTPQADGLRRRGEGWRRTRRSSRGPRRERESLARRPPDAAGGCRADARRRRCCGCCAARTLRGS